MPVRPRISRSRAYNYRYAHPLWWIAFVLGLTMKIKRGFTTELDREMFYARRLVEYDQPVQNSQPRSRQTNPA